MDNTKVKEKKLVNGKSVYVFKANDGTCKIGVSNNVELRKNTISNQSGKTIVDLFYTDKCSNSYKIETFIHDMFSEKRLKGEWFAIDFNLVCEEIKKAYKKLSTKEYFYEDNKTVDVFEKKNNHEEIDDLIDKFFLQEKQPVPTGILDKLQHYVDMGILSHIPKTYAETMDMVRKQQIRGKILEIESQEL